MREQPSVEAADQHQHVSLLSRCFSSACTRFHPLTRSCSCVVATCRCRCADVWGINWPLVDTFIQPFLQLTIYFVKHTGLCYFYNFSKNHTSRLFRHQALFCFQWDIGEDVGGIVQVLSWIEKWVVDGRWESELKVALWWARTRL